MALARVTAPVIDWQFPGLAKLVTEAETNNYIIVIVVLIISPPPLSLRARQRTLRNKFTLTAARHAPPPLTQNRRKITALCPNPKAGLEQSVSIHVSLSY